MNPALQGVYLALVLLLLLALAAQGGSPVQRATVAGALRGTGRLLIGLALFAGVLYATAYFLALVGGFYESLTCKVVTLPACEDPLALPAWLGLPAASVGGVIGILPLLGIFLAKSFQGGHGVEVAADEKPADETEPLRYGEAPGAPEPPAPAGSAWRTRLLPAFLAWLLANASLVAILFVELWLAWLRGAAEAADRQVRLSLGLDAELPAAYLGVAQWGAVVLALGLSVVVVYLGVAARYGLRVAGRGFGELGHGARLVDMVGAVLAMVAAGLTHLWIVTAIVVGRLALKLQSGATRVYVLFVTAFGRLLLKLQSAVSRSWLFLALLLGRFVLFVGRVGTRVGAWLGGLFKRRPGGQALGVLFGAALASALLGAATTAHANATYVVLQDVSGGEASRLEAANRLILGWADPSPQLALLERNDRLVVIPVRAPGELDTVYAALFNAAYQGSQLDRFAFFAELRNVLPQAASTTWGTGLSEALRTAAFYLRDAPPEHERVLIVFGNGEDHSAAPVTAAELAPALQGAVVVRLNAGLDDLDRWTRLYQEAGASGQVVFDQAATRLLSVGELRRAIERARTDE